jgi:hypothetical protein
MKESHVPENHQPWQKYWETSANNSDFMHRPYSFEDAIEPRKKKSGIKDGILNPERNKLGIEKWDFEPRKNKLGIKDGILNPKKNKLGIKDGKLNPEKMNWTSKVGY